MPLSFLPRHIYPALTAIDPARLASEGVRLSFSERGMKGAE